MQFSATIVFALFMLPGILFLAADVIAAAPDRGKAQYEKHCAECHGADGKGNGPGAASLPSKPADFTTAKFWKNNADKKIENSIKNGHKAMPPISLSQDDVKAITGYMSHTFKK